MKHGLRRLAANPACPIQNHSGITLAFKEVGPKGSVEKGGKDMSLHRGLRALAGFMVMLSLLLTVTVSPHFVWLTLFIGINLFQSAFTNWCPAMTIMHKLGFRD